MGKRNFGGFPGRGPSFGGNNMNNMLKQLQKVQQDMLQTQEEIKNMTVEASSGGGMVKAKLNGEHRLISLEIKPEAVDTDDLELLSDLIMSAVNEAQRILEEESAKKIPNMNNIPGGLGGLF